MGRLFTGSFYGSVMFVDIKNFLAISEILTPEQVRNFIYKALEPLSKCIKENEGYICQIQGDAILAVFGLKKGSIRYVRNAVECAMQMQKIIDELNPINIGDICIPLEASIGISTGDMYSCYIEVEDHRELTVLGKTVNLASRYQKLNKHYGTNILIDKTTFNYIRTNTATKKLDKIKIDGCHDKIILYEVLIPTQKRDHLRLKKKMYYEKGLVNYLREEWEKAIECFQRASNDNIYVKMWKCCRMRLSAGMKGEETNIK